MAKKLAAVSRNGTDEVRRQAQRRVDERSGARGDRPALEDSGSTFDDIDAVVVGKARPTSSRV